MEKLTVLTFPSNMKRRGTTYGLPTHTDTCEDGMATRNTLLILIEDIMPIYWLPMKLIKKELSRLVPVGIWVRDFLLPKPKDFTIT